MEVTPLCDNIEVYVYLRLDTTVGSYNSEYFGKSFLWCHRVTQELVIFIVAPCILQIHLVSHQRMH